MRDCSPGIARVNSGLGYRGWSAMSVRNRAGGTSQVLLLFQRILYLLLLIRSTKARIPRHQTMRNAVRFFKVGLASRAAWELQLAD